MDKKVLDILNHEGVVTIISKGKDDFHVANTWNSYIHVHDDLFLIPAAGMHHIEDDVKHDSHLYLTIGSKEVEGTVGPGAGFHLQGIGSFITQGEFYDEMKKDFPFLSRVLVVKIEQADQKI